MTQPLLWPVTPLQAGLVALAQLRESGADDPYVGQSLLRIDGPVDPPTLGRAVETLTHAHPNLRAGFVMDLDVDPLQFIADDVPVDLRVHALGPDEDPRTIAAAELAVPFDLDDPPLVRWLLLHHEGPDAPAWLVLTAHHAVLDGWSMPLLVAALAEHHRAVLEGAPAPAPAADYSRFLAWVSAQPVDRADAYWAGRFAALELTGTAPWLVDATDEGAPRRTSRALDADTVARLRAQAAAQGTTPAAVARAAWGLTLDHLAGIAPGRGAAVFATTVSGRPGEVPDADLMIGLFADAVLTEVPAAPGARLADIVRAHHDDWLASLPHQHIGLRGCYRALGREELATSLFSFEGPREVVAHPLGPGVTVTLAHTVDRNHYPLAVTVVGHDGGDWLLDVEYDAARVGVATADQGAGVLAGLLRAFADDPDRPLAEIDPLDDVERERIRSVSAPAAGINGSALPPLLPDAYAATVVAHPDRTALVVGTRSWTFAELDAEVVAARAEIGGTGGPGRHVLALCLPRDERMVVGILAGLAAGAAVLPVDPAAPADRRVRLLSSAGATLLWDETGLQRLTAPVVPASEAAQRHQVASIVFTSGSTGPPKPVAVGHDALAHLLHRQAHDLYPATEGPLRVAHTASFHFDAHWDAFLALICGHELHVLDQETFLDSHALAQYAGRRRIDYLDFTPTVWSALLAGGLADEAPLPRTCVVGGEAFPPALWTRMRDLAKQSGARVVNLYGPTEACVDTLAAEVADHDAPVVGRAIGATSALVLDALLRPVPVGTWGELYLAGPQLAQGYLGQPGRTAERFVARPGGMPGERIYRTGDLAMIDPGSGALRLGGRTDDQLSLHGYRIEPGEIERILLTHDEVAEAAVVAVDNPRLGKRLVGYVVPTASATPDLAGLLSTHCAGALARHLVPSRFVALERLPLTSSGKLDRRALPLPQWGTTSTEVEELAQPQPPVAAVTAVRESLARALGARADAVGEEDDFFALGGDSIAAIRVSGLLRRAGWQVRGQQVLSLRTPLAIAAAVVPVTPSDAPAPGPAGGPALTSAQQAALAAHVTETRGCAVDAVLWLTPTQQGILLDSELAIAAGSADPYRTTATLRIDATARLTRADVRAALDAWLVRHPNLAIGTWQHDLPEPVAFVPSERTVPLDVLTGGPDQVTAAEAAELARDTDFAAGRLVGATWIDAGQPTSYLVVSMHHLLTDGWSLPILADDLADLLAADPPTRAVLTVEVRPGFAEHLRWVAGLRSELDAVAALWRTELAGLVPLRLPEQSGVAPVRTVSGAADAGATARWQAVLAECGFTWAEAVQAAWALAWGAASGTDDVCFGLTGSGRSEEVANAADMVGLFITTRPVRLATGAGGAPAQELLAAVRASAERTDRAQHLGLGLAQRSAGGTLFDSLVVVENYPRRDNAEDRSVAVIPLSGQDGTGYPVTLTVQPGARLEWEVEGRHPALTTALLAGLQEAFEGALVALLDDGTVPAPDRLSAPRLPVLPVPLNPPPPVTAPVNSLVQGKATDAVTTVARAAARVLGLEDLAPDADFFAHGGDSIAAIALVGALRSGGLVVGVRAVFEGRTPVGIAALASATACSATALGPGELPLTPALSWFVAHTDADDPVQRQCFQQVRALAVPADVSDQEWAAALDALAARHPALRLALRDDRAEVLERSPGEVLAGRDDDPVALARRLAALIDPEQGVVLRAGLARDGKTDQLVLVAHHIAVDAVSWRILTDDLRALVAGERLPEPGGVRDWAVAQHDAAPRLADRIERWEAALPADALDLRARPLGSVGDATEVTVELDTEETARFLAHTAAGTAPDHLFVAALAAAAGCTVVVEAEGHGRDLHLSDAADPADTVGWLTATWPVPVTPGDTPADTFAAAAAALDVTDGPEYGVLRHLLPEGRERLSAREAAHPPQVLVNYLGREDLGTGVWQPSLDSAAVETELGLHDALPASHPLELNAYVAGDRLIARWQVAAGAAPTARALADRWADELGLLLACSPDELAAARTPYDAAGMGPGATSALLAEHPEVTDVEAVWPLTPVQRGMWFHAVTDDVDGYTSAVALDLHGPLDSARLRRALVAVVARHPQLRLGVLPLPDGSPVAVSRRDLRAAWHETEEPGLDDARRQELLTAHEREPFDLAGPLLRAHLARIDAHQHHLVLANHHLLLDGWSVPLLVRELLATYAAGTDPAAAVPDPRHTDQARLAAWQQAHPADAEAWRDRLAGVTATLLAGAHAELADAAVVRPIDAGWTAVETAARASGVTVSTLVITAWTVVLGSLTGRDDVVTGTVVAGRPGDLLGADKMLGMFVTTLPVRTRWEAATTSAELLEGASAAAIGRLDAGPVALGDLHRIAGVPTLFDSLVVVENYPHDPDDQPAAAAGLTIAAIEGVDATHYPLSLTVEPGESLRLEYAVAVLGDHAPAVLDAVVAVAAALVTEPDRLVAGLVAELRDRLAPVADALPRATDPTAEGVVDPERLATVRTAFATALGLPEVAPDDDVFALGGDSIVAMRVVSALREHGLVVRPKALFAAPTPAGLAAIAVPADPEPVAAATAPSAPGSLLDFDPTPALEDLLRNP